MATPPGLLLVDDALSETHELVLRAQFATLRSAGVADARRSLHDHAPAVVVTELQLPDGDGVDVCRLAKSLPHRPLVIAVTAATDRVPAALEAGCDAILLKPCAPNLLCSRIGRLRRLRESSPSAATTNRRWSDIVCPNCHGHGHGNGALAFDFAEHRKVWFACLACQHVWLTRPRGEMKTGLSRRAAP